MFGTIDVQTGDVFCVPTQKCNAVTFLDFLKQIVARYPKKMIVMILDNARIHHAKLLRPFLEEHRHQLFLLFLPPYSPELNPIEKMWGWVKETVIANCFHKDHTDIQYAIDLFLAFARSYPERVLRRIGCFC